MGKIGIIDNHELRINILREHIAIFKKYDVETLPYRYQKKILKIYKEFNSLVKSINKIEELKEELEELNEK